MSQLVLETQGETFIVVKRRFEAPPEAVYRAHLDPPRRIVHLERLSGAKGAR